VIDLLEFALPRYQREGKSYLTIGLAARAAGTAPSSSSRSCGAACRSAAIACCSGIAIRGADGSPPLAGGPVRE